VFPTQGLSHHVALELVDTVWVEPRQPAKVAHKRVGLRVDAAIDLRDGYLTERQRARRATARDLSVARRVRRKPFVLKSDAAHC